MFIIFLLSPFREEIYPWYAIWFFVFICLVPKYKGLLRMSILLSLGLMIRYLPYMYFGEYYLLTIRLRTFATVVPLISYFIVSIIVRKSKTLLNLISLRKNA